MIGFYESFKISFCNIIKNNKFMRTNANFTYTIKPNRYMYKYWQRKKSAKYHSFFVIGDKKNQKSNTANKKCIFC